MGFFGAPTSYTRWWLRFRQMHQKNPEGSELENMFANDAKMVVKVAKLAANLVAKNDANLALPPRFHQVLIESP
ncbi:hypothetical protein TNCV_1549451 [Trichonephila clavipes]|nr:hypothetical protein TNCV_1549451 [Trichonephila clavipes]